MMCGGKMAKMQKNEPAAEKAMDSAIEFMNRKERKEERDAFLRHLLFGM